MSNTLVDPRRLAFRFYCKVHQSSQEENEFLEARQIVRAVKSIAFIMRACCYCFLLIGLTDVLRTDTLILSQCKNCENMLHYRGYLSCCNQQER